MASHHNLSSLKMIVTHDSVDRGVKTRFGLKETSSTSVTFIQVMIFFMDKLIRLLFRVYILLKIPLILHLKPLWCAHSLIIILVDNLKVSLEDLG